MIGACRRQSWIFLEIPETWDSLIVNSISYLLAKDSKAIGVGQRETKQREIGGKVGWRVVLEERRHKQKKTKMYGTNDDLEIDKGRERPVVRRKFYKLPSNVAEFKHTILAKDWSFKDISLYCHWGHDRTMNFLMRRELHTHGIKVGLRCNTNRLAGAGKGGRVREERCWRALFLPKGSVGATTHTGTMFSTYCLFSEISIPRKH